MIGKFFSCLCLSIFCAVFFTAAGMGSAATRDNMLFRNQKFQLPKTPPPTPAPPATATFSAPQYEVVDLQAELFEEGTLLYIAGKIQNSSQRSTRGYVVIYFQDGGSGLIGTVETDVNKSQPFQHGQAGVFEVAVNIAGENGVSNISVEYVEKK